MQHRVSVHLGLGREDKEEEEEEGGWLWDPGEEGKAEAREGTVILHLCGQFLGAKSLSTDQEAPGSYRNAPPPSPSMSSCLHCSCISEGAALWP